eukprot:5315006-Ditylum_brightwellii.AAC.1
MGPTVLTREVGPMVLLYHLTKKLGSFFFVSDFLFKNPDCTAALSGAELAGEGFDWVILLTEAAL